MGLNFNYAGRCLLPECPVMLHEEHGGAGGKEQFFQLDAGKDIDKIQRLIPEEQVRRLTERGSQQHLLLRDLKPSGEADFPCVGDIFAKDQFDQAGFPAAVLP